MAEEMLEFENTVEDEDGRSWTAVVVGEGQDDDMWIGWIRFDSADGTESLTTERETTQPNREDLAYWASGLTYSYLEGALARARREAEDETLQAGSEPPHAGGEAPREGTSAGRADAGEPTPNVGSDIPRMEISAADGHAAEEIMGVRDPEAGTTRTVPDAGTIVYEGATRNSDGSTIYRFAVQTGDGTARSMMANWLWSRLHRVGARARVDGVGHLETNADLRRALER